MSRVALLLVSSLTFAFASVSQVTLADDIALTVARGTGTGECLLTWAGGTSPYQAHRTNQPQGVVAAAHLFGLATAGNPGLSDTAVPVAGAAYFYVVVSGTCGDGVRDLSEGCDDGGIVPGDGCSAGCQVETAAVLALTPGLNAFGTGLVAGASPTAPFQVTNEGDMTSGALSFGLVAGDTSEFTVVAPGAGDCVPGATLTGHASCTVPTRFVPLSPGAKTATLQVMATPGGTQQSTMTGTGQWPLTLNVNGTGQVTRDGVVTCTGGCPETTGYADGAMVTFLASPQNGSGHFFSGWSGACAGTTRSCVVTMNAARNVTARFSPMIYNLGFVSAAAQTANLGSANAYDARCNVLATAAGLNNASGNAYVAWVSDALSNVLTRLGTARGWVRMDNRPFATTTTSLQAGAVYYPIRIDEYGVDVGARAVMTGINNDGVVSSSNCMSWTSSSASQFMTTGDAASGSGGWSSNNLIMCSVAAPVYCLMKTITATLVPTIEAGKRIYLSENYTPGLSLTPDQRCGLDKPAGLGTVKALVATTVANAAGVLSASQRYVRPDGMFIGTGADLAAGGRLTSGMWQTGAGVYAGNSQRAWTGAATPTSIGTAGTTCTGWTSSATTGLSGAVASSDAAWWSGLSQSCSTTTNRLFCVEQ